MLLSCMRSPPPFDLAAIRRQVHSTKQRSYCIIRLAKYFVRISYKLTLGKENGTGPILIKWVVIDSGGENYGLSATWRCATFGGRPIGR
jgi:hypothetical protein